MARKHQPNEIKKLVSAMLGQRIRIIESRPDNLSFGVICEYVNGNDKEVAKETGASLDYVRYTRRMIYGHFPSEIADRDKRETLKQRREEHKRNSPQLPLSEDDLYNKLSSELKSYIANEINRRFAQLRDDFTNYIDGEISRTLHAVRPDPSEENVVKLRRGLPKELKGGA